MSDKKMKVKKMTMGKFYKKQKWSVRQLTTQQRKSEGYRLLIMTKNQTRKYIWLSTHEFKRQYGDPE